MRREDQLGYLFTGIVAAGTLAVAHGIALGWLLRLGGNLGWAWLGRRIGMSSIVVTELAFIGVDLYGYWAS